MTAIEEILEAESPVLPAGLLVQAGYPVNAFEALALPFQIQSVRLKLGDAAQSLAVAVKAADEQRAVLRALVALRDYLETEPDPEQTFYKIVEAH
jgi:hypothetical protein